MPGLDDINGKVLDDLLENALIAIGKQGADVMRSFLDEDNGVSSERLKGSISWATARTQDRSRVGGSVKDTDLPAPPKDSAGQKGLNIGTGVPYAKYVNYGALPHGQGSEGNADPSEGTFMDKMWAWAERQSWYDGSPEAKDRVHRIAYAIAEKGTDAVPFFEPSFPRIQEIASAGIRAALGMLGAHINVRTTIVTPQGSTTNTKAGR